MTRPTPPSSPPVQVGGRFRRNEPVPAVVNAAFWILVVGAVLTGIILVTAAIRIAATSSGGDAPVLSAAMLGGTLGVLIRIGIAVVLRRGYGPARVYLTVVGAYSMVIGALNGLDPIGLFLLLTVAVPVILAWLPPASRYFRVVGEARRQAKAAGMTVGFLG